MKYTDLNEKIKLLTLVQKNTKETGHFAYPAFLDILSSRKNKQEQPSLSEQERLELFYLVQKQTNNNGRFDYLPFIEQIAFLDKVLASKQPEQNQPHVVNEPEILSNSDSESVDHSQIVTISQSQSIESSSNSNQDILLVESSKSPEEQSTFQLTQIDPSSEAIDQQKEQELQRLQKIKYLKRLFDLVKKEMEITGKFTYQPFQNIITIHNGNKSNEISKEARLLEMVIHQIERTGQFDYPNFIKCFSDANKYILTQQNLRVALRDITEGINGLQALVIELQDIDYQQKQKLLQLISQGTYRLETFFHNYYPSPKKPVVFPWTWFEHQAESPTIIKLRERIESLCLIREIVYEQISNQIDNHSLLDNLSKLQIYSTDIATLLDLSINPSC